MYDITDLHDRLRVRIARQGRRPEGTPLVIDGERRSRSLRTCHLPADYEPQIVWRPNNGRYVPELAAAIDDDPNLCDGARRCARKIAEYAYRYSREERAPKLTVTYLARGLRRCRRTVQRYLRQLERAGYIAVEVLTSARSGLCVGIAVRLASLCFPKHHAQKWPDGASRSGVTRLSVNHRFRYIQHPISRHDWALRCMNSHWRAHLHMLPRIPAQAGPSISSL